MFNLHLLEVFMGIQDWLTKTRKEEIEAVGNYRIKAHIFTNEYFAYDDIGASTRLERKNKIFGRTWWKDVKGPVSTRALYVMNTSNDESVIAFEEHKYQDDNYVSIRSPRFAIKIGGEVGEIFDRDKYQFEFEADYLDWEYVKDKDWGSLKRAIKFNFPVNISFPKDKVKQFDGVIGFHAARKNSHEFRRMTTYNVGQKLIMPKDFRERFDYYINW
jgi:hypothetical protein